MADKPDKPERPQRPRSKSFWPGCYEYPEWCLEWILYILSRMAIFEILEIISKLGIIVAVVLFFMEAEERHQRKQYEAWQVVINMQDKTGNGGRIAALQDLNKDGVSLFGIEVKKAYLAKIKFKKAQLQGADFSGAILYEADFEQANLYKAKFRCVEPDKCTDLYKTNFQDADLRSADFSGNNDLREAIFVKAKLQESKLQKANLQGADFKDAELKGANFECAKGLTPEQIKRAKDWQ